MNSVEYNSDLLQQKDPLILLKSIVVSNPGIMLKQGEKLLYCKKAKRRTVINNNYPRIINKM